MTFAPMTEQERRRYGVYQPDPMGRLGQGRWVRRRDPFGRMTDEDVSARLFNDGNPFDLTAPVGRTGRNDPSDVAKVEQHLIELGYLNQDQPTGYWGLATDDATRRLQKDQGLKVDGLLNPKGETIGKLKQLASAAEVQSDASTTKPPSKDEQVAMAPVLPLLALGASSVLGVGAAIKAQQHRKELEQWFQKKFGSDRTDLPPDLPKQPGLEPTKLPPARTESPAEIRQPAKEILPIGEEVRPGIFIHPMPDQEMLPSIVDRNESEATKREIDQIRDWYLAQHGKNGWEHVNGGRERLEDGSSGQDVREFFVGGPGLMFGDGRKGSVYTDLTFRRHIGGGKYEYVHIQHADVKRNGELTAREIDNADRIRERLGPGHSILIVPKKWQNPRN